LVDPNCVLTDQLSGSDIQKGCLSAREEEDKATASATLSSTHRQEINKQMSHEGNFWLKMKQESKQMNM